jgi:subtilase family serine protease
MAGLTLEGSDEAAAQSVQVLQHHVRPQVSGGSAAFVSYLPSNQQMSVSIVLPLRNQAALNTLLGQLYNPASPNYRQFLSVAEFTEQFGPAQDDYQAVVAYAQSYGLTVTGSPANRLVVPLSGTVDQINSAFNVRMSLYQHPAQSDAQKTAQGPNPAQSGTFFSTDREPSLALSVPVSHIAGLDNFAPPRPLSLRRQTPVQDGQQPSAVTGSGPGGSYLGSDMRAAYYGATQLDGTGQAVGLLEFGGYLLSDVNSTFSNAGQTYNVPINNVLLDGATGAINTVFGDSEQTLDIVQAIGMAPGLSQVRVYIGVYYEADILNSMASENIAKQLSCSWSWYPADPTIDDVFFEEMAAQGQSFFTASGDEGAYDLAINTAIYPADDAYVTAVGGTHLATSGAGGTWVSESVWNSPDGNGLNYGSGGGISPDGISIPSWQVGLATTANGGSSTLRNVPDVAMEGDFDNYACGDGACYEDFAGTSFAAPRWAGFMALINQQAVEAGSAPKGGLGFLNPPLYQLAQGANASTDLHDITVGNNDTENQPVYFNAVPGYDLTTGWGSAAGPSLINDLAGPQVPGFWIESSQSTVAINPGASASATISVTDAGGFTGSVNFAVTSQLPSGVTAVFAPTASAASTQLTLSATSSTPNQTVTVTLTGTSGNLTESTTLTLVVHTPAFALSAAPGSLGITPGASGTSTITVTPEYGFTGNVTLAASGLPSGVTASFSPASTSGTSVLTLTTTSSATGGSATVTITGTSGSVTSTCTLALTINGPSFTLENTGNVNIGQGSNGTTYVYVFDEYGFTGNVNLAISGLPSGVTASFSQNPTSYQSVLTLSATTAAPVGQSTLTITGTSGSLSATTTLTLGVYAPTFTLFAYGPVSIGQGNSTTTSVYVNPEYGFNSSVSLTVSGLPTGVTASFSPNPTTGYTTLTLLATSSAPVGTYPLTITGTYGTQTATTTIQLGVYVPTFTLSAYSVNIGQGSSSTTYVYVSPLYGFTGSVNLTASGLPSGMTASFAPNPTNGQSMLTLAAAPATPTGQFTATITGTYGTQTVTTTFSISVFTPTFTVSGYGTGTIGQGRSPR